MYEDLCIITPTLNEVGGIGKFLLLCKKSCPKAKIIISDDGSKDGTKGVVLRHRDVVFLDRKDEKIHGLTISVLDAIKKCDRKYFIVIDSDLQHPVKKIGEIYNWLRDYDVVIGRRVKVAGGWPIQRKLISKMAILLGRLRLIFKGFYVKDVVSGFFGMKADFARNLISKNYNKFELRGYKVLFDFLKYMPSDAKVKEVDYIFDRRIGGESKINKKIMLCYFRSLFR